MVRIALVEGGRAGMWGGMESVRVRADGRVGRRARRRWVRCMVGCWEMAMWKGGLCSCYYMNFFSWSPCQALRWIFEYGAKVSVFDVYITSPIQYSG